MAAEQAQGGYRSIALVDLSYLFKRNWHGTPRDAAPGTAAQQTLNDLAGIRESVEHVIICCDAPPYRRKEIYPEYKAQREAPEEAELSQKRWLMDRIDKAGYVIAKSKGYEADDVIYTLCKRYWWCEDVRIIGSDKDAAQCVTETCRMFVPAVGQRPAEIRGPKEIVAKFGVEPKDMALWLALVGDTSDNIPGVPGVGPKKAAQLIADCKSLVGIAEALATSSEGGKPSAMWNALAQNWDQLVAGTKLTALEEVPLDAAALLEKRRATPIVKDEEEQMQNEVTEADFDPISRAPEARAAAPASAPRQKSDPPPQAAAPAAAPPQPAPAPAPAPAAAAAPAVQAPQAMVVRDAKYGIVSADLQPQDLQSARAIALWVHNGQLYPQFPSPEAVFTVILRGKELGISAMTALAGFHVVEGKPTASADLIRALAERSHNCEYFRLIESSTKSATWETKHRAHKEPTRYTYTIEEAEAAGLLRPTRSGKPSNWVTRPRDLLTKTSGSKLARIVYVPETMGLYCTDEIDE